MTAQNLTFGDFLIEKRKERKMSGREFATALGISPVYLCDMEKGRRTSVADDFLDRLIKVLVLSEEETNLMYDLVAIARNTVSPDLPKYIMENELIRTALRVSKKNNVPDEKWEKFLSDIIKKE
jgi:transcriptional regulator with XRE-family HTH domain